MPPAVLRVCFVVAAVAASEYDPSAPVMEGTNDPPITETKGYYSYDDTFGDCLPLHSSQLLPHTS